MKMFKIMFVLLLICCVSNVLHAADEPVYHWFTGVTNGVWDNPAVWSNGVVPNDNSIPGDVALVNSGYLQINTEATPWMPMFGVAYGLAQNSPAVVDINAGGALRATNEMIICSGANAYAIVNVFTGGIADLVSLRMASDAATDATLNIDGGIVTVSTFGTYLGCDFWGGDYFGKATINVLNGGVFEVSGEGLSLNRFDIGSNGSINVGNLGTFKVTGDVQSYVQNYINSGRITGMGDCTLSYDSVEGKTIYSCAGCLTTPEGDLNFDCRVNFADFAVIASNWLDCAVIGDPDCNY